MKSEYEVKARRILSNNVFDEFCEFFTSVLSDAKAFKDENEDYPLFIVTVRRRCTTMFSSFYTMLRQCADNANLERPKAWEKYSQTELNEIANIFDDCVITADASLAMTYDIVDKLVKYGVFPRLIVVDELMCHGRDLNRFLYNFEKRILKAKHIYEDELPYEISDETFIESFYLGSLSIRVANKSVGPNVLLPRYNKNLMKNNSNIELKANELRAKSLAYTQYAAASETSSAGVYFEARLNSKENCKTSSESFVKVETNLQNIKQDTWIYMYPNANAPKIICAVQCSQRRLSNEKEAYTPLMFVDNVDEMQLIEIHNLLVKEANADEKCKAALLLKGATDLNKSISTNDNLVPWMPQTTNLVLTSWILKKFLKEVKGINKIEDSNIEINWNTLASNFRIYDIEDNTSRKTIDALKEILSLEPHAGIEDYLDTYTRGASPIETDWQSSQIGSLSEGLNENSYDVQCVEDVIQNIGVKAEIDAYTLYGSGISFSDEAMSNWGSQHSLGTLLDELKNNIKSKASLGLYEAIGIIAQAIDLDLIDTQMILGKHPCENRLNRESSPCVLYTWLKISEPSLNIVPTRYRNLLHVLEEIQWKRGKDFEGAKFDIGLFVNSLLHADNVNTDSVSIAYDIKMTGNQLIDGMYNAYKLILESPGQEFSDLAWQNFNRIDHEQNQKENVEVDHELRKYFLWAYRNM